MGTVSYFIEQVGMEIREDAREVVRDLLEDHSGYEDLFDGTSLDFDFFHDWKFIGYFYDEDLSILRELGKYLTDVDKDMQNNYALFTTDDYSRGWYKIGYYLNSEGEPTFGICEQVNIQFSHPRQIQ